VIWLYVEKIRNLYVKINEQMHKSTKTQSRHSDCMCMYLYKQIKTSLTLTYILNARKNL